MTNDGATLTTSPLLFFHPERRGLCGIACLSGLRFKQPTPSLVRLCEFFLQPRTLEEAIGAGWQLEVVVAAERAGILVNTSTPQYVAASNWEENGWSRAGFLTFSQLDLPYSEPAEHFDDLQALTDFRRKTIIDYLGKSPYPNRILARTETTIRLNSDEQRLKKEQSLKRVFGETPTPAETAYNISPGSPLDFDALLARRSVRSFSDDCVSRCQLENVLFDATSSIRAAEQSRGSGDPYYLLNSFFSWLNVYILVQAVDEIERGVYQYDPLGHELRCVRTGVDDTEIMGCIQEQYWITGGGFCIFTVVHWERYMWVYRHSRAYLNLLIQLGEFQQELLSSAYQEGLGGWLTPAVSEGVTARLLKLEDAEDPMVFMKLGKSARTRSGHNCI